MECAFQQFESSCWGDMGSSDVSMLQREQFLVKREPIAVQQLGLHQVWYGRRVMLALWQCIVTKPSWQWRKRNACSPCHAHRSGGTKDSTWWCSVSAHCVSLMLSILALPASGLGSRLHRHTPILVHEVSAGWIFVAYYVKKNCDLIVKGKQRKSMKMRHGNVTALLSISWWILSDLVLN